MLLLVGIVAPLLTIGICLPRALFDFVMVTCLEGHINKELIRDVLLEHKKKLVSQIFAVVQTGRRLAAVAHNLSDPSGMVRQIAEHKAAHGRNFRAQLSDYARCVAAAAVGASAPHMHTYGCGGR